ncbi:carbamate kinase [candidate division LCP-89 bacterium B3_LCP]|uniref:Carbamate kinase n=1 Tax=candidate division LCP-89 bacterium B3_LCP TaxID=2012998 RepID=A0A532V6A7_UNCL8|nr:MAG: carbamate kinase [candidate division LCP-89 bacterium B3_LCP]
MNNTAIVALGGNAISSPTGDNTIAKQFTQTRKSMAGIIELIHKGYEIVITHGNGPQVGEALLRMEHSLDISFPRPLGVLVADTQGGIGYMIEQSLQNGLKWRDIEKPVATLVTQVVVDRDDPELSNPTKYIGRAFSKEVAEELAREHNWIIKEDKGRGFRRVVGSPIPLSILNKDVIRLLLKEGYVVVAAGGGGIPVFVMKNNFQEGIDAVIDKDRAAAVLANDVGADELFMLTEVDKVCLNFGTPEQVALDRLNISEARKYLEEGHFPPGNMGPKIEASIQFLEAGGKRALVSSVENVLSAVYEESGTWIYKD